MISNNALLVGLPKPDSIHFTQKDGVFSKICMVYNRLFVVSSGLNI